MPKISIVTLTFNSKDFISSCLNSIFNQNYQDFEVVLVDNGSRDGSSDLVKKNYSQVILIENRENLGACRARNQGIEASSGEWILTLDCDVVLEKDFLSKAVNAISQLPPDTGIVQPKILNFDNRTIYSCGIRLSWMRRFYDIGRRRDSGEFSEPERIFGACSACAFYKRQMLKDIKEDSGYFDERFFFLVEDVDLAWRAKNKHWKASLLSEIKSYHSGASCRFNRKLRQFLCFRNRYYSIVKNEGIAKYSTKILPVLCYDMPRIFFLALTNPYIYGMEFQKAKKEGSNQ